MMKIKLFALTAFLIGAFSSAHVLAHHSFAAEFDSNAPLLKRGVVLKVDWTNPHGFIHIEVENEAGEYETWSFETGNPGSLTRRGWTRDSLPVGTDLIIRGTQARDGSNKGNAQYVVLAETCARMFTGTSQRDFDEDEVRNSAGECILED